MVAVAVVAEVMVYPLELVIILSIIMWRIVVVVAVAAVPQARLTTNNHPTSHSK